MSQCRRVLLHSQQLGHFMGGGKALVGIFGQQPHDDRSLPCRQPRIDVPDRLRRQFADLERRRFRRGPVERAAPRRQGVDTQPRLNKSLRSFTAFLGTARASVRRTLTRLNRATIPVREPPRARVPAPKIHSRCSTSSTFAGETARCSRPAAWSSARLAARSAPTRKTSAIGSGPFEQDIPTAYHPGLAMPLRPFDPRLLVSQPMDGRHRDCP